MDWFQWLGDRGVNQEDSDDLSVRTSGLPQTLQVYRSVERWRLYPCNLKDRPAKVRSRWGQGERSAEGFTLIRIFIGIRSLGDNSKSPCSSSTVAVAATMKRAFAP